MLIAKQKLYTLLDVINDKLVLLPKNSRLFIDPKHDLKGYYPEEELINLLLKLQNDEKVLKVTQWPPPDDYREKEEDTYYGLSMYLPAYQKYLLQIQQEPEYKSTKPIISKENNDNLGENIVLKITYTKANDILINDFFQLARPDFDSENEVVFEFLYHHPNKKYTIEEIGKVVGRTIAKSPHKIVENLGFTGDFKRIFMQVTKNAICFKNPITRIDLEKLGITRIKLPR